jgi:hypothetical protein
MVNGNLDAPYEGASIEAANIPDALLKAKKWAASVEVADNSWLQILLDGRSVRSLKPGSFWCPKVPVASAGRTSMRPRSNMKLNSEDLAKICPYIDPATLTEPTGKIERVQTIMI